MGLYRWAGGVGRGLCVILTAVSHLVPCMARGWAQGWLHVLLVRALSGYYVASVGHCPYQRTQSIACTCIHWAEHSRGGREGVQMRVMAQKINHFNKVGLKHWLNINNLVLLNIRTTESQFVLWKWNVTHVWRTVYWQFEFVLTWRRLLTLCIQLPGAES
jgi:hypothetical protein